MSVFPEDELELLIKSPEGPCVSIYLPTHKAGAETQQDPIRLKNLLREAEDCLLDSGLRAPEARQFLKPALNLLNDGAFWLRRNEGLAIFLAVDRLYHHRLPVRFEELVVVTERFHVKPLLPLLSGDGGFYVLALSQNDVRLLRGSRYSVSEQEMAGAPKSLAEALSFLETERQYYPQTGKAGEGGKRTGLYHGHGGGTEDSKTRILEYFRQIDKGLGEFLREETAPLVLAGVEFLFPIYREANSYPHLLQDGVVGNPEALSADELHIRAWALVEPAFRRDRDESFAKYLELKGGGRTSKNVREVVRAAYHRRVEVLFVALGVCYWGSLDPESDKVRIRREPGPGDVDLLDFAAIHTYLNGGDVYAVEQDEVPGKGPLAAVFRY